MLETLNKASPDKILALMKWYRDDPRDQKIDLGVGIYRDETGATPVLKAVREAEKRLYDTQNTKAYVAPAGDAEFNTAMLDLVLGDTVDRERLCAAQAPGGTGALRVLADLLAQASPGAQVWLSDPTWANHPGIFQAAGFETRTYPYFDSASKSVDFAAMAATLRQLGPNDIVVLHGCCHNPCGADLSPEQWDEITDIAVERGFFPFVDLAYLGLGNGLEEDTYGVRRLAGRVAEMVVAVSCSKNFGLYRERVGCAMLMGRDADQAATALTQLLRVTRSNYSMPPDHGAALVKIILQDPELRASWESELAGMRNRMNNLRELLCAELKRKTNTGDFDFIAEHRGMFSLLGLSPQQVEALRESNAVYMTGDSRINIAGLRENQVEVFADALLAVTKS